MQGKRPTAPLELVLVLGQWSRLWLQALAFADVQHNCVRLAARLQRILQHKQNTERVEHPVQNPIWSEHLQSVARSPIIPSHREPLSMLSKPPQSTHPPTSGSLCSVPLCSVSSSYGFQLLASIPAQHVSHSWTVGPVAEVELAALRYHKQVSACMTAVQ